MSITGVNASEEINRATAACDAESFVREQRHQRLTLSQEESALIAKAIEILKQRGEVTDQRVELIQGKRSLGRLITGDKYHTERLDTLDSIYQSKLNDIEFQRQIIHAQIKVLDMQVSTFKMSCGN